MLLPAVLLHFLVLSEAHKPVVKAMKDREKRGTRV
jgi:hypothetical protein